MRVFLALAACFGLAAGIAFPEHDCDEISDCAATLGQLCYEQVFGGGGPAKVDEDVAAGVAACLQGVGSPSAFDEEGVFQDAIYDEANVLVGGAQACVAGDEAALKHKKLKDAQAYLDCLDSKEAQDRAMYEVGEDGKKVKIPHGLACTQIFEEKCAVPERFADDPQKQKEADCCRLLAGLALGCPADNERYYFDLVTRAPAASRRGRRARSHGARRGKAGPRKTGTRPAAALPRRALREGQTRARPPAGSSRRLAAQARSCSRSRRAWRACTRPSRTWTRTRACARTRRPSSRASRTGSTTRRRASARRRRATASAR
mmetsp:Transcript_20188/g.60203  ORF Transcript_20188/g.60203 Transcript_20188/m.60203 type:complete len:318 (-) Transcript_20188:105-1058(-)